MIFSIENVINSLAGVLKEKYPYPVYANPNQQGTKYPCFFIMQMPSTIESQTSGRFYRDLGLDIIFVQQRNIPNAYKEIRSIAEYLDENLELFTYSDDKNTVKLRTYERKWSIEDSELHYKFHIKQRVSVPRNSIYMGELEELNGTIK